MPWYLVKTHFVLDDGETYNHKGWYEADDFIDACEKARCSRAWDLRPFMREGEFTHPERVVSSQMSAKRYNVHPRPVEDDLPLGIGQSLRPTHTLNGEPVEFIVSELPGATREDIARLDEGDWRDVQEAGYGFER